MFRLRLLYPIFFILLFVVFHIAHARIEFPYAFINLLLLLAAPMALFYEKSALIMLALLSVIFIAPYMIFAIKADPAGAILSIIIFNLILFSFFRYRQNSAVEERSCGLDLERAEEEKLSLLEDARDLAQSESQIREEELSTVVLYEVTKKMSEELTFSGIFDVFGAFFKTNFTFRRCDLLILNRDENKARLEKIYSVWKQEAPEAAEPDFNLDKLIKFFIEKPERLYFSRNENGAAFEKIEIKEKDVWAFIGIPLMSDGSAAAILIVENLPPEQVEKFIILSMQFALEIKKVLLYEAVERMATTDSLTGLYVRHYFYERLGEELARSRRFKLRFALLVIDIDDFKKANDTYGHLVGDVILKNLGHILKENTREIDLVSRYGGEEFALALPETGPEGAKVVAQRIRRKVEEHIFKAYDEKLKITISTGISIYPKDSSKLKEMIEKADKAMYKAKKSGKNLVYEYKREYNSKNNK